MKKNHLILVVCLVVALAAALGYIVWKNNEEAGPGGTEPAKTSASLPSSAVKTSTGTKKPAATSPTPTEVKAGIIYADALSVYRNSGRYFQFVSCRANPGYISMKTGTTFMLDNRDTVSHKVAIGNSSYNLLPYGFAIAAAPAAGQYYVTCDGGGSALLNVEK